MAIDGNIDAGLSTPKKNGFISMASRTKFLVILFVIAIVLEGIATLSNLSQVGLLGDIASGLTLPDSTIEANDARQALIGLAQLILILVTAVVFLRWFYRTHANLTALEVEGLKYKSNWAVWYFFIPILNIIRPFQVAVEMWKASFSVGSASDVWQKLKTPSCVSVWWIFYIIAGIVGGISARMVAKLDVTIDGLILSTQMDIASSALWVVSTIFAITMVKSIAAAQEEKARAFSSAPLGGFTVETISGNIEEDLQ